VKITLKGKSTANVRLIDCVGFMVEGAIGDKENDKIYTVQRKVSIWNSKCFV
jgi:hypothetical protein